MERVIGTCSICGGDVTVPDVWYGIYPPKPTCRNCGAVKRQPTLDMVPMEKPKHHWPETREEFLRMFGKWS